MGQLQFDEASSLNLADRLGVISRRISDTFSAPWLAEPIGSQQCHARFNWACAENVDYSLAEMPAIRLVNRSSYAMSDAVPSGKFYVFTTDQRLQLKMDGRPTVHLN